jgi:transmembrane sensor
MSEIYNNIDDLLGKKLANEISPEEENTLQNWLKESPNNEQYFKDFQWLWAQTHLAKSTKQVDTEGALATLHTRMDAETPTLKAVKTPSKIFNIYTIMKAAAVVFIAFGLYNQFAKPIPPVSFVAQNKPQTDTLMDGSIITLNKKSGLTLSERFNKNERRMKLTGEAYFQVAHDATRPFVVDVQDVEVKAVGTAFNIDNVTDARFVSILVTDGKIKISGRVETKFAVKGETAIYDTQLGTISIEKKAEDNKLAYKTRQFRFDETPLSIAVAEISKAYSVSILLKNKELERCPVVVTFDNKSLEEMLEILKVTCPFTIEKVGDEYILSKDKVINE